MDTWSKVSLIVSTRLASVAALSASVSHFTLEVRRSLGVIDRDLYVYGTRKIESRRIVQSEFSLN